MSRAREFLDFLDGPVGSSFTLAPEEAMSFFAAKGLKTSFDWRDMLAGDHVASFTVAKMMDADLLADVHASLLDAMATGTPFREWADSIIPTLQAKGWWGRKAVLDPVTGHVVVSQLGSPGRLQTIFRTNMQTAYAAGAWAQIQDQAEDAPFLLYDAVDDHRTRPEHAAWDGQVHPVESPFWQDHYPPNGWNCRCGVIQLSDADLHDLGLKVTPPAREPTYTWTNPRTGKAQKIPQGIDPGWNYNPGQDYLKHLAQTAIAKARALPPTLAPSALKGITATEQAAADALDADLSAAQAAIAKATGAEKRGAMKAAERSAQTQLDQAVASKTPYLSTAITSLLKTKAGKAMAPGELLAAAQVKAAQAKASANLSAWKSAYLADKPPSALQQAAFDGLPEDAQGALLAQLDAAKADAKLQAAAQQQLDAFAAQSAGTLEAKALAKLAPQGGKPTELLAAVQAEVAAAKLAISQATTLAGLKKSLATGKLPTPAQAALLDSMTPEAKAALLAEADAAKAAAMPAPPVTAPAGATMQTAPGSLNPETLVQIGPQRGSNPGGLYRDTSTGDTWYIKTPPSADHARNEVLAAKLYQAAGIDVPELRLTVLDGKPAVASRIVDDLAKTDADGLAQAAGTREGFVVDAWLANWDVVGAGYDNLLVKGGKAVRVDTGGALLFRAQGTAKGAAFGDAVTELETFLDMVKAPQAARVFKGITQQQLEAGAARVLALSDDTIRALVAEHGPLGPLGQSLAARLIARKADLAKRFGQLTQAFTKAKAQAIEVAEFAAKEGLQAVDGAFLSAIKGIALRTAKGSPLEPKDLQRVADARAALASWDAEHRGNLTGPDLDAVEAHYRAWLADLDAAVAPGAGKVGAWKGGTFTGYTGPLRADPAAVKVVLPPEGLTFTPQQAKAAMAKALGSHAASMDVPARAGSKALEVVPLEHRRAIVAYTGSHYREVNEALRAGTATATQLDYVRLLNEALALAPKFRGRVTRGITRSGADLERFLADHRQALVTGQAVVHKGFNSTTKGESAAFSGNIVLRIESRTGVWVQPISLHPGENEVLLRAGTRFLVKDIQERGGRYFIDLEEVGP